MALLNYIKYDNYISPSSSILFSSIFTFLLFIPSRYFLRIVEFLATLLFHPLDGCLRVRELVYLYLISSILFGVSLDSKHCINLQKQTFNYSFGVGVSSVLALIAFHKQLVAFL